MIDLDKWQLIVAYISGNSTNEQQQDVHRLCMQDPLFEEELRKARTALNAGDKLVIPFDKEKGHAILSAHVDRQTGRNAGGIIKWMAAACIIAVIAGTWFYTTTNNNLSAELIEITVAKGSDHRKLVLDDGTTVYLNGRTTLKYPRAFGTKERKVFLEGDAFFEVKQDATRPFVVGSGNINTLVLGTSFRIKSDSSEQSIEVMVATGKVAVKKDTSLLSFLEPGKGLRYNTLKNTSELRTYRQAEINSINDHLLYFNSTSFPDVAKELEKWYGVTVIMTHPHLRENLLSGEFRNASLHDILESMAISSHISFKQKGDTVYLSKANH